jgi:hypothetical protein
MLLIHTVAPSSFWLLEPGQSLGACLLLTPCNRVTCGMQLLHGMCMFWFKRCAASLACKASGLTAHTQLVAFEAATAVHHTLLQAASLPAARCQCLLQLVTTASTRTLRCCGYQLTLAAAAVAVAAGCH